MATMAMVATAASTSVSMVTMNQAARLSAWGEGCVMPMVLMNALEMRRRNFTAIGCASWSDSSRFHGVNRMGGGCIY